MIGDRLWTTVKKMAAELVVHHKDTFDANLIEKTMHHIINTDSTIDEIRTWLNVQMQYANYFERSLQTRSQLATTLALIEEFNERGVAERELAEVLGWTVRLIRYYAQWTVEARSIVPKQSLFVPALPDLVTVSFPRLPSRNEAILRPRSAATTAAAEDLFSQLQARWQSDENEGEEQAARKQKRDEKKNKKK